MGSSGDFTNQATSPQPVDFPTLSKEVAKAALNDVEMSGIAWADIPTELAEYALDIMVHRLIELGHKDMTVGMLAWRLGVTHYDGSWV